MKNKRFLAVLLVILIALLSNVGIAAQVYYYNKVLPKISDPITPNIYLQTTGEKQDTGLAARHRFTSMSNTSNTQAVRMWRDDGVSVTTTLFHAYNTTYSMGVGSTTYIPEHTYLVRARGNTSNAGSVTVSGWVDSEGGDPI